MKEKYPEHEKLKLVKDKSQVIGEFLVEWLPSQNLTICEFTAGDYFPAMRSTEQLLADFFGIDRKKLEEEKRQMLEEQRCLNRSDQDWNDETPPEMQ